MRWIRSHVAGIAATAAMVSTLMLGQTVSAALGEDGATGWRDAEVPAAGLKLKIPAAWDDSVVPDAEPIPVELPDAYEDASPATFKAPLLPCPHATRGGSDSLQCDPPDRSARHPGP